MENHLQVQWKHHQEGMLKFLEELRASETFVDVTLCCEGQKFKAHRVVLSACSPYLQQVLVENPADHATIILHEIGAEEMRCLLRFMYCGSANVPRRCLRAFLRAAHALKVSVLMPGTEHTITEEAYYCRGPPPHRDKEPQAPGDHRPFPAEAMLPHDLSTSAVKAEVDGASSVKEVESSRSHFAGEPSPRPQEHPPTLYRSENVWSSPFREGLMGHQALSQRHTSTLPRPTPVVRSPWSHRSPATPWKPPPVIGSVHPPTPPPNMAHMEPIMCQSSAMDTLAVPTMTPLQSDLRKPCCCPSSPFCPSPSSSSSAYSTASSWSSNAPPTSPSASSIPSPRPPALLPPKTRPTESPHEGTAALAVPCPVLRNLSPNTALLPTSTTPTPTPHPPSPPSPPSSPSRYILKQRRLRDFYRSMQTDPSHDDSKRVEGQTSDLSHKRSVTPNPPSAPDAVPSSLRQWPTPSEQSVIRLSPRSAFQPPQIILSPPEDLPPPPPILEEQRKSPEPSVPTPLPMPAPSVTTTAPPKTNGSGGPHACDTCGKTFGRRQLLEQHRRTHTGEKPFECTVCGKSFTQRGHWSVHQRLHDGSRPHVCPICGKAFVSRASLKVHHRTHTGEKPFRCEDCGKQFSQLRNFKYHRSVHEGTKEFACTCPECGKQFNDRGYLSSHLKIHRNRKEYACEHCEKRFNQRVAYNMHVRIHTGEKPHACGECGKRFGRKMLLRQHARTHTGERPFRCAVCGKAFADRSNMALHARLHSGEKPHACNLCGKAFTKKHHLKTHMNFHTGVKPYACERCGLRFSQSSNMRTHAKKCTAEGPPATPSEEVMVTAVPETVDVEHSEGAQNQVEEAVNVE
ncbi:hypothetical protein J437_LFUL012305 [Ladona fulva]|uniref:Uncharacterized protein n=1 Tax=Ladona fulva TaxID=123851 RepID=A0A8K0KCX3_LADFU|nr:hypothetical protein J437_LFUL012305 [Ladona fulva]